MKSRSLLSYEDEPHPLGLGGDYPDQWDRPAVVMAAWRSEQQQKGEETRMAEVRPPFNHINDTQAQKALLLELQR